MGGGSYSSETFSSYAKTRGYSYDTSTDRVIGHTYKSCNLKSSLNPKIKSVNVAIARSIQTLFQSFLHLT